MPDDLLHVITRDLGDRDLADDRADVVAIFRAISADIAEAAFVAIFKPALEIFVNGFPAFFRFKPAPSVLLCSQ
jgi:hypothetical protein